MSRVIASDATISNKDEPSHHHHQYAIDVAQTMDSGQVFLWNVIKDDRDRACWYGINGQDVLRIDNTTVSAYHNGRWRRYKGDFFRSTDRMRDITRSFPNDKTMKTALRRYSGLRIMRQNPFQCMISFIVSANSNIQRIRTNLAAITERFGDSITIDGVGIFHTFPKPETLANAHVHDVLQCGVGYRAKYVVEASKMIASETVNLDDVARTGPYDEVMDAMLRVPGVGRKVADCIMLFSLERLDAFPLDRWMMRVLDRYYGNVLDLVVARRNSTGYDDKDAKAVSPNLQSSMASTNPHHHLTDKQYKKTHQKITDYFGPYAGYAQQMLFKMARDDSGAAWRQR